jgi:hypothetical protein
MASELRVNTLKDAAGNNSVGMEYVANGSAKAWVNFNGTGTIAARDSLNFSSLTDHGTGSYSVTFNTSFSNNDYAIQLTGVQNHSSSGNEVWGVYSNGAWTNGDANVATNTFRMHGRFQNTSGAQDQDADVISASIHGDLA